MYKVMLIDDDVPMLKYLRQLINWEELGLHICGDTYSSVKALQLFRELQPDIVISDIGLPKMDGLELAAEFKQQNPETRIIFLTCHEDFYYAKKALTLNANDYLIKDELTSEQLESSLLKCVRSLRSAAQLPDGVSYRDDLLRNADVLKLALFRQFVKGGDTGAHIAAAKRLGIAWNYPSYMLALGTLEYASMLPRYEAKDTHLIRYSVYNIAGEVAKGYEGITVFNEDIGMVALQNYRPALNINYEQRMQAYLKEVQERCSQYLQVQVRMFCGPGKLDASVIGATYKKLLRMKARSYYSPGTLLSWNGYKEESFFYPLGSFLEQGKRDIADAVREGDHDKLLSSIRSVSETARSRGIDPAELIQFVVQLLRLLELQFAPHMVSEQYYAGLQGTVTLEDTMGMLRWRLEKLLGMRKAAEEEVNKEPKLQEIDHYIADHLFENITSIDVANYLCLNSSYFSRYFKRLTGDNFTDYLHRHKMGVAARMLEQREESVEMVALKLGYSDRTYFSKVFKKYMGATPREYREK
ncbi:response regulator transcription factor [Paenibacillus paeoniae]|uniref:Response regulator n=1 Tax=Paenibacillus paeoniae TaxID=2292705 RepID=A0A371P7Y4_9BACL|nr:response regulator [Paenibacillus paeoniae]REK71638.1 response regulator [Paenibacillus paeoniae]